MRISYRLEDWNQKYKFSTSSSEDCIEHRGINGGMKTLKLPTFNEDKDDLDAYLNRFERACQAYAVTPEN